MNKDEQVKQSIDGKIYRELSKGSSFSDAYEQIKRAVKGSESFDDLDEEESEEDDEDNETPDAVPLDIEVDEETAKKFYKKALNNHAYLFTREWCVIEIKFNTDYAIDKLTFRMKPNDKGDRCNTLAINYSGSISGDSDIEDFVRHFSHEVLFAELRKGLTEPIKLQIAHSLLVKPNRTLRDLLR